MSSRQNNQYPVPAPHLPTSSAPLPPKSDPAQPFPAMNQYAPAPQPYAAVPVDPLEPYAGRQGDRVYRLKVVQQPIRARMCGFGDKDRRPITPPPCIKLSVCDANTGKELEFSEVDSTFFVLTVDLWNAEGVEDVNLVRHANNTPTVSISNSTTTSYPPPPPDRPSVYIPPPMAPNMMSQYDPYNRQIVQPPRQHQPYAQSPIAAPNYYGHPSPSAPNYPPSYGAQNPYGSNMPMSMPIAPPPPAQGMYTRNLIGSLTVNASRLNDPDNKPGFWFVLQDLSVRTEGTFRLKMNFVDVGSGLNNNTLNTGKAPVLATCFSQPFQVFSAKKFPGVIESTPLSKCFALQGIKIPIRKDGPKSLSNQHEYDADEM